MVNEQPYGNPLGFSTQDAIDHIRKDSPCYDRYGACWCCLPAHHKGRHYCVCETSWEDVRADL